jgi:hypothetical protein
MRSSENEIETAGRCFNNYADIAIIGSLALSLTRTISLSSSKAGVAYNTLMSTQNRSRPILIHGLLLVMAGLLFGFVVPHTPYPRLALGAHIRFVTNGILIIVMAAMLLKLPHQVGPRSVGLMLLAAWLIWPMALSEAQQRGNTQ